MIDTIDFSAVNRDLIERGLLVEHALPHRFMFPNAELNLRKGLSYCIGEYKWLPEYANIVEWLTDNHHKGLTLMGGCGLGKTVIGARIIPMMVNAFQRYIVNTYDSTYLAKHPDAVIEKHIVMIDDVGVEQDSIIYGERRKPFCELVDQAEKKGKLLIVTTNLTKGELMERYGERTVDRLMHITKGVKFNGKSFR